LLLIPAIYLTFEDIGKGLKRFLNRKKKTETIERKNMHA